MNDITINLIPYRAGIRAKRGQTLGIIVLAVLILAGILYYGVYTVFNSRLASEQQKVTYLKDTVSGLNTKIASISDLRKKRAELITRENLITKLQDKRDMVVNLFNTLIQDKPKGIFLTDLNQSGAIILLNGYSEDNENIADFMRKIKESSVFTDPQLHIISSGKEGQDIVKHFILQMSIRSPSEVKNKETGDNHVAG